ncbi:MAG: acyl carrier protein [Bacteroidetes bacterium]|nr:acyl carrier protein [Bacteroidota bacterium]
MEQKISEIKNNVRGFISQNYLQTIKAGELNDSTPLISGGIIDSIATMKLVNWLEKNYNFEFAAHEVDRDNLDTIERIANFVVTKTSV